MQIWSENIHIKSTLEKYDINYAQPFMEKNLSMIKQEKRRYFEGPFEEDKDYFKEQKSKSINRY